MGAPELIVAGISARMMTESARAGGFEVIALDLFGDADTRHAAQMWEPIGDPATLRISPEMTLTALARLRQRPHVVGWVAGAGFEDQPELLAAGAKLLPLLGNSAQTIQRIKTPESFFATLQDLGIPHPETRLTPPENPADWLCKQVGGAGGWHIRPASQSAMDLPVYYQRVASGVPMSAVFLAIPGKVNVLGIHRQWMGQRELIPYMFEGVSGPVALSASLTQKISDAANALSQAFELVGMNSLDFLLEDAEFTVLEVNPRPTAALALYDEMFARGLMDAHIQACQGMLPQFEHEHAPSAQGYRAVFTHHEQHINASLSATLMRAGWCHDIPVPGTYIGADEPFCTVSARAPSLAVVDAMLHDRSAQINDLLKALHVEQHVHVHQHQRIASAQRQYS
jgi:predicted ATP-grasp superfamily ATP-dependent carboligase